MKEVQIMKCKWCGEEIDKSKLSKYASGEFCSTKCARSWATKFDNKNETKVANCIECGKEIEINKRASIKTCKCEECKNRCKRVEKKACKWCGQSPCKRPDVCKRHRMFSIFEEYFGFDTSKIGTIDIYEEFDRVKNVLIEDYWDNEMSRCDIMEKYNINKKSNGSVGHILKILGIDTRSIGESIHICWKNGKASNDNIYNQYKCGWHRTWNDRDVFYRSSYELDYAKQLDEQQIDYDMENLRILYWDSREHRQGVAIPDFYLPESNTIVEIKSDYTYDEQNMRDKIKSYKEHGYQYKLILEKKEIEI